MNTGREEESLEDREMRNQAVQDKGYSKVSEGRGLLREMLNINSFFIYVCIVHTMDHYIFVGHGRSSSATVTGGATTSRRPTPTGWPRSTRLLFTLFTEVLLPKEPVCLNFLKGREVTLPCSFGTLVTPQVRLQPHSPNLGPSHPHLVRIFRAH